jgi:hypothetical protein
MSLICCYSKNLEAKGGLAVGRDKDAAALSAREEAVLKVAKEIVVKFIEVGRLSPTAFPDTFTMVMETVRRSLED